jgi:hypothetical protein
MPKRLVLAAVIAFGLAAAHQSAAEPMVLDPNAMRQLADKAIHAGYAQDALEFWMPCCNAIHRMRRP